MRRLLGEEKREEAARGKGKREEAARGKGKR